MYFNYNIFATLNDHSIKIQNEIFNMFIYRQKSDILLSCENNTGVFLHNYF